MSSATIATVTGSASGLFVRACFVAQAGAGLDVPGWITSAGVGGALVLVFWIVAKELPENRKARREAHADFKATLKELSTNFHDELKSERNMAMSERAEHMKERAVSAAADRDARHAMANAVNAVATTVRDLGERMTKG